MIKNLPVKAGDVREMWVQFLGQEDPLEEGMAVHSGFLPGDSHGQRSLVGYSLLLPSRFSYVQLCATP